MIFHKSYSVEKQKDIYIYKDTVFLRKNHKTVEQNGNTLWECDETVISIDEFNEYADFVSRQNAIKGINDSDNIASLVSGQSMNEFNQLATMEAIADLYEALASSSTV